MREIVPIAQEIGTGFVYVTAFLSIKKKVFKGSVEGANSYHLHLTAMLVIIKVNGSTYELS